MQRGEAVHRLLHDARAGDVEAVARPRGPGRTRRGSGRCRAGPGGRGERAARCAATSSSSISARRSSSVERLDLRAPRARCGSRRRSAGTARALAAWRRGRCAARSCASCTEPEASMAKPVCRQAITSEWSPKIERAWVASVRAATCMQNGRQLARDLVHVGDHQQQALRGGEGGGQRARLQRAVDGARRRRPRTASRRPSGTVAPDVRAARAADQSSASSPIVEDGRDRVDRDHLAQRGGRPRPRPRCRRP